MSTQYAKQATSATQDPRRVITGLVRFSYVYVFEPRKSENGEDDAYSVCIIIPKTEKETIAKIRAAIDAAVQMGLTGVFNGKRPANMRTPLRDGDAERADREEFKNSYFINAKTKIRPEVVDIRRNPIMNRDEFYSGCWGLVSLTFFPYSQRGSSGITAQLNNIMKVKNDTRLGSGSVTAADDFAGVVLTDYGIDEENDEAAETVGYDSSEEWL